MRSKLHWDRKRKETRSMIPSRRSVLLGSGACALAGMLAASPLRPAFGQYATEPTQYANFLQLVAMLKNLAALLEVGIRTIQSINFHSLGDIIAGLDRATLTL